MAMSRLMPPSTCSSKTTSASVRPAWGRASGALSIFTIRATRFCLAGSATGAPVSGEVGAAGGAVVVVTSLVGTTVGTSLAFAAPLLAPPPPQAASSVAPTTSAPIRRTGLADMCGLELLQGFDAFLERGCHSPASFGRLEPQVGDARGPRLHGGGVGLQLLECGQEPGRVARHADRLQIGQRFRCLRTPQPAGEPLPGRDGRGQRA